MNVYRRPAAGMWMVLAASLSTTLWGQTATQPEGQAPPAAAAAVASAPSAEKPGGDSNVGYVRGNNVYIRSGSHQNYYPVSKLNRGDRVTVLGSEFGWLKIAAPPGTYSLVEKTYLDRMNDQAGVLNDAAQVYAGSNLDDRRYAKQLKLPKGASVQIIGETADGAFCKIQPPPGAALWIKGDLIDRTGRLAGTAAEASPTAPKIETVKPGELNLGPKAPKPEMSAAPGAKPGKTTRATPGAESPAVIDINKYQMDINALEAQIAAEATKSLSERHYEEVLAKLQSLADQSEDETTQLYAKARIKQLQDHSTLVAAMREMQELKETTFDTADQLAATRARIKAQLAQPTDDIVVRGTIRVSGLYDGEGSRPLRWRIVEPGQERTLAYIELAAKSPIDPVQYYGKYVGIRAIARRMQQGTIPPVPVYTVQEIVVQNPQGRSTTAPAGSAAMASPQPHLLAAPGSQPAAKESKNAGQTKPETK